MLGRSGPLPVWCGEMLERYLIISLVEVFTLVGCLEYERGTPPKGGGVLFMDNDERE